MASPPARANGATSVAVVGASMGGTAAADAAVRVPGQIDRLVLLGSPLGKAPHLLVVPTLVITARGDTTASGTPRLVRIQEQYDVVPGHRELLVLDGTAHAQALFATAEGPAAMQAVLRFLAPEPAGRDP